SETLRRRQGMRPDRFDRTRPPLHRKRARGAAGPQDDALLRMDGGHDQGDLARRISRDPRGDRKGRDLRLRPGRQRREARRPQAGAPGELEEPRGRHRWPLQRDLRLPGPRAPARRAIPRRLLRARLPGPCGRRPRLARRRDHAGRPRRNRALPPLVPRRPGRFFKVSLSISAMRAHHLTPILNVSNIQESFAWFEKLGWNKGWDWGDPPTFGGVCSGKCEIFLCENGQGGRGRSSLKTTFGPEG